MPAVGAADPYTAVGSVCQHSRAVRHGAPGKTQTPAVFARSSCAGGSTPPGRPIRSTQGGTFMIAPSVLARGLRRGAVDHARHLRSPRPAGFRTDLGPDLQHPGLEPLLPLSLRLLSAKLLFVAVLQELRRLVLPLSARNAGARSTTRPGTTCIPKGSSTTRAITSFSTSSRRRRSLCRGTMTAIGSQPAAYPAANR